MYIFFLINALFWFLEMERLYPYMGCWKVWSRIPACSVWYNLDAWYNSVWQVRNHFILNLRSWIPDFTTPSWMEVLKGNKAKCVLFEVTLFEAKSNWRSKMLSPLYKTANMYIRFTHSAESDSTEQVFLYIYFCSVKPFQRPCDFVEEAQFILPRDFCWQRS